MGARAHTSRLATAAVTKADTDGSNSWRLAAIVTSACRAAGLTACGAGRSVKALTDQTVISISMPATVLANSCSYSRSKQAVKTAASGWLTCSAVSGTGISQP